MFGGLCVCRAGFDFAGGFVIMFADDYAMFHNGFDNGLVTTGAEWLRRVRLCVRLYVSVNNDSLEGGTE